jgi:hypothetical protein
MPKVYHLRNRLNPLNQKPNLDYVQYLLSMGGVPHALFKISLSEECCVNAAILAPTDGNIIDLTVIKDAYESVKNESRVFVNCVESAIASGVKPNCGVPEVDEAVKIAQANPRDRQALERVECLTQMHFASRLVNEASRHYAVVKNLTPCGFGNLLLLPGNGAYDLPQSKLGIARLLSQLLPSYIQVEEGWNDYTRVAYVILKAPGELLPHVIKIASRLFNIEDMPVDRFAAYVTVSLLLSTELGVMTLIDFDGDEPFVVKLPKSPLKLDEP